MPGPSIPGGRTPGIARPCCEGENSRPGKGEEDKGEEDKGEEEKSSLPSGEHRCAGLAESGAESLRSPEWASPSARPRAISRTVLGSL